jgi:hypothetical protein
MFLLFLFSRIFSAQPATSKPGISENLTPDTVQILNQNRDKNIEKVRIKNSRAGAFEDSAVLRNSDETGRDNEKAQTPALPAKRQVLTSSHERVRGKGKIITGAALFGVSYGLSLVVGTTMSSDGSSLDSRNSIYYYIPVLGPALGGIATNRSSNDMSVDILFVGWSVAEGMGLALLIAGLVGTPAPSSAAELPLSIEPLVMRDRARLTVRMRF